MIKFKKSIIANKSKVLINGKEYTVKNVHETRNWIQVHGIIGSFQTGHVEYIEK
jgi:hypothetical protein